MSTGTAANTAWRWLTLPVRGSSGVIGHGQFRRRLGELAAV
ncbi:hypothetical protein AB0A71_29640 [Kitasatospora aureofaciens]